MSAGRVLGIIGRLAVTVCSRPVPLPEINLRALFLAPHRGNSPAYQERSQMKPMKTKGDTYEIGISTHE
jgi:hypothetical protein